MIIYLTEALQRQMAGWLIWEKDHLLSIRSMSRNILIPTVTGSLEIISNDLEMANRMRFALRPDGNPDFQEEDCQTVLEIASNNRYEDKVEFWNAMKVAMTQGLNC